MTLTHLVSLRSLSTATAAAVAGLSLVACGPEDRAAAPAPLTTTMTSSAPAPTTTEVVTETGAPADDTVQQSLGTRGTTATSDQMPQGEWDLSIADVRVGHHNGFDRVVIEFTGTGTPGWFASYTTDPRQQGSGHPIGYRGDTAIDLMARGVALPVGDIFPVGDTGAAGGKVTGVSHNGIFEGQAQFVIGLEGAPRPYTVTVLDNPSRLVVDIQE